MKFLRFQIATKPWFFLFAVSSLIGADGMAAPIPLTSSSAFFNIKNGLYRSSLGYTIHSENTNWIQAPPPKGHPYVEAIYRPRGPQSSASALSATTNEMIPQASLTVRKDTLRKPQDLEIYANAWKQDFLRFGFDILSAKKVKIGNEVAFLLDLSHSEQKQQLRQVLFLKDRNVVTLTCRDEIKGFNSTLKDCNQIIKNFSWNPS